MAWGRAVKARHAWRGLALPALWIFTDQDRLPDPLPVLAGLPRGLCGVVLRAGRGMDLALADRVARLCRQLRFALVVAGDPRLAARLQAGRHMGRHAARTRRRGLMTAAAHHPGEMMRAVRLQADAVFLSPVFPTASHPGASGLGVVRWAAIARARHMPVMALGGITAASARRLPRFCAGAGVVGAASGLVFSGAAR